MFKRLRGNNFKQYMEQRNMIGIETEKIFLECFPFLPGETAENVQGVASRKRPRENIDMDMAESANASHSGMIC